MTELAQTTRIPDLVPNGSITIVELEAMQSGDFPPRLVGDLSAESLAWPALGWENGRCYDGPADLREDLARHGILEPLAVCDDFDGPTLVDGHHRALVLIEMGWPHPIPVYWNDREEVRDGGDN